MKVMIPPTFKSEPIETGATTPETHTDKQHNLPGSSKNEINSIKCTLVLQKFYSYEGFLCVTEPLHQRQDLTQGQFFSGIKLVEISIFTFTLSRCLANVREPSLP